MGSILNMINKFIVDIFSAIKFGTVQISYQLMLFTHKLADTIKEVQVNIPFSFFNVLCVLVWLLLEVTVGKDFFLFCSNNNTCK